MDSNERIAQLEDRLQRRETMLRGAAGLIAALGAGVALDRAVVSEAATRIESALAKHE